MFVHMLPVCLQLVTTGCGVELLFLCIQDSLTMMYSVICRSFPTMIGRSVLQPHSSILCKNTLWVDFVIAVLMLLLLQYFVGF